MKFYSLLTTTLFFSFFFFACKQINPPKKAKKVDGEKVLHLDRIKLPAGF